MIVAAPTVKADAASQEKRKVYTLKDPSTVNRLSFSE
jgi:hypothetical protein